MSKAKKEILLSSASTKKASDRMFAGADKQLFEKAAMLRRQPTHAEEILWGFLRSKPLGYKFRRQHPYLNYILDFYCHAEQLVIEVDGSIHNLVEVKKNDEQRQKHLEAHGLKVLRFNNEEIKATPLSVFARIETYLKDKLDKKKE